LKVARRAVQRVVVGVAEELDTPASVIAQPAALDQVVAGVDVHAVAQAQLVRRVGAGVVAPKPVVVHVQADELVAAHLLLHPTYE
jgi:hypothetical protein